LVVGFFRRDLLSHLPGPEMTPLITTRRLPPTESTPLIPTTLTSTNDRDDDDDNNNEKRSTTHILTKPIDEKTLRAPKTPVTVQSTFDDAFQRQSEAVGEGDSVGSRVDLKVLEGEKVRESEVEVESEGVRRLGNRRGVGPGITWVFGFKHKR
jgi:hypothetical protein